MSLFHFGFTWKSLDTVTKSEDIQATQQLNSTKLKEPGDKRKAESQPEVFAGKSKRDQKILIPNVMGARLSLACTR